MFTAVLGALAASSLCVGLATDSTRLALFGIGYALLALAAAVHSLKK